MSDSINGLNDQEMQALNDWRNLHYRQCLVCSSDQQIVRGIVAMPIIKDGQAVFDDKKKAIAIPFVPIVCLSCGFTVFVAQASLQTKPLPKGK